MTNDIIITDVIFVEETQIIKTPSYFSHIYKVHFLKIIVLVKEDKIDIMSHIFTMNWQT